MEKIFLIDGSSYIYRAFHAIRDLKTSQGVPTNAVYGFTTMLVRFIRESRPRFLAVILDARGPTFRHTAYEHYKANRPEMPESLREQIPRIKEIISAYGISMLEKEGFEADDLIGTLSKKWEKEGHEITILSGDKDLFQLVAPRVSVHDAMLERTFDLAKVRERFGVEPERLPDVFGLMGDTSDNIPGVPGIGEKGATSLIKDFGSLEKVLTRSSEVSRKSVREALQKYADQALLSKQLATIDTAVPLNVPLESLRYGPPDVEQLRELFKELEFHRLLEDLTPTAQWVPGEFQHVGTSEALGKLQKRMGDRGSFALSGVTTDSTAVAAELVGLAVGFEPAEVYCIPFRESADGSSELSRGKVLETLRGVLEDPGIGIIGHDLKRPMVVLRKHGIRLKGVEADTMVASYLINPLRRSHELDAIALDYLDRRMTPLKERRSDLFKCACEEIDATLSLAEVLVPRLKKEELDELFQHLELPLIPVLAAMEMKGVGVDIQLLKDLAKDLDRRITGLEVEIKQLAGEEFNINSHQQLGRILFEKLKLPVIKKTKTGYSTDVDVLRELSKGHDLPAKVLDYRSLGKLKSTYVDALPRLVNPETGRIHTSFNQAVTATGRLSSSDPNLQNIPIRSELGRQIRGAFVPREGTWLLSADYSQIELRILAHLSKDPILLEAFRRDEDIHTRTAAEIFGVSPDEVVPEMRREAKVINFGIIYGMSAYGLARELDVGPKVAAAYIDGYFQRYKGVREFIDNVLAEAKEKGYVETMMKRRRYLPEIGSSNVGARRFAERTAINTPIQGTAADIIKKAMIQIQRRLDAEALDSNMILQVHDELLFEVPDGEREAMRAIVSEGMENAEDLEVRLKVDVGWGKNWADAH